MRIRARFAVAALTCAACARGDERADPAADRGTGAATTAGASGENVVSSAWRVLAWEPHAGVDPADLGTGVVFLRRVEDKGATAGTDTLLVRSAPNASAPAVGAMLFTVSTDGVVSYQIASPDSLRPNLTEYGYEESGLPFDSTDATGRWVRAILGFGRGESARVGWVDAGQAGVGVVRWVEQLADRPLFYAKPELAAFFATPDSSTPVTRPRGGVHDYAMHPEEVRGPWMRVRLVEPSDNCVEPDSVRRRTRRAWIRYLDDRGRPNVWYYTRGC